MPQRHNTTRNNPHNAASTDEQNRMKYDPHQLSDQSRAQQEAKRRAARDPRSRPEDLAKTRRTEELYYGGY